MSSYLFLLGMFLFVVVISMAEVAPTRSARITQSTLQKQASHRKLHFPVTFSKCWNSSDCHPKECCAGVSRKIRGACVRQPQLKERCNPFLRPGTFECPCRVGMTCVTKNEQVGEGRCVYVTTEPDEVEEAHPRWIFN
ncbi:PREDICTED: uncharacterized protein LOC107356071 isoform X1 [Acropora digitifera]|uniref:uncharacterized protein LOC107356071 isoform X1 n=2 Tax=Acropora digitifera TaxID=70779 RepID=UPI00077A244D|nr:PREDICTED: uncharacterized protein LOC107356071 isoform X1 [Acropora digitifera]